MLDAKKYIHVKFQINSRIKLEILQYPHRKCTSGWNQFQCWGQHQLCFQKVHLLQTTYLCYISSCLEEDLLIWTIQFCPPIYPVTNNTPILKLRPQSVLNFSGHLSRCMWKICSASTLIGFFGKSFLQRTTIWSCFLRVYNFVLPPQEWQGDSASDVQKCYRWLIFTKNCRYQKLNKRIAKIQ